MLLLSALAIALLTLLGAAGESLGYDRWLKVNTAKYRTHSLFRQGLMLYEHVPNWPEYRLRPLMEAFGPDADRAAGVSRNIRRHLTLEMRGWMRSTPAH